MDDIIKRIDDHLAECDAASCQELEPDPEPILRACRDEIIAARACAEMMLQGTGQRMTENIAERVMGGMTVGAWIPVSERLPERNEPVCVAIGGTASVGTYSPMLDDWWALVVPTTGVVPTDKVTHWMPLPEPPEVKW